MARIRISKHDRKFMGEVKALMTKYQIIDRSRLPEGSIPAKSGDKPSRGDAYKAHRVRRAERNFEVLSRVIADVSGQTVRSIMTTKRDHRLDSLRGQLAEAKRHTADLKRRIAALSK